MLARRKIITCAAMLLSSLCSAEAQQAVAQKTPWAMAVHGGAGESEWEHMDPATAAAYHSSLARALEAGTAVLRAGGRSLDAVRAPL